MGSKGSGVVGNQVSAANSGSLVYMDEFDVSVAKLNIVCFLDLQVAYWIAIISFECSTKGI